MLPRAGAKDGVDAKYPCDSCVQTTPSPESMGPLFENAVPPRLLVQLGSRVYSHVHEGIREELSQCVVVAIAGFCMCE